MSAFCRYCARFVSLPCHNTRDMEEMAADDAGCSQTLDRLGRGEKGMLQPREQGRRRQRGTGMTEWCPWCEMEVHSACRDEEDVFRATLMGETDCMRPASSLGVAEIMRPMVDPDE